MFKYRFILIIILLIMLPLVTLAASVKEETSPAKVLKPAPPSATATPPVTPVPEGAAAPITHPSIQFALTFDDGPNPNYTPQIVAILDKYQARATFFMVGYNFTQYPELVRKVAASGNEIGSHTMTHPNPDTLSDSELDYEITTSLDLLQEISGQPIHYFRTPYGMENHVYRTRASELGVKIVYWTVDPRDWSGISSDIIAQRVLDNLQPGCIVLLHDGVANSQETVDALDIILREATARGYAAVTLSDLGI